MSSTPSPNLRPKPGMVLKKDSSSPLESSSAKSSFEVEQEKNPPSPSVETKSGETIKPLPTSGPSKKHAMVLKKDSSSSLESSSAESSSEAEQEKNSPSPSVETKSGETIKPLPTSGPSKKRAMEPVVGQGKNPPSPSVETKSGETIKPLRTSGPSKKRAMEPVVVGQGKNPTSPSVETKSAETIKPSPTSGPSKKRAMELVVDIQGNTKRSKPDDTTLPGLTIIRAWSDVDKTSLLNGIVEFKNKKGSDPYRNIQGFVDFMKGRLSAEFSGEQMKAMFWTMRDNFSSALRKRTDGKDPIFSDPWELTAYKISKKIWGDEFGNVKSSDSLSNEEENGFKKIVAKDCEFWGKYPHLTASLENLKDNFPMFATYGSGLSLVKERLELIGDAKAKELDEKWKEFLKEEMELHYKKMGLLCKKMGLISEQVKLALDG